MTLTISWQQILRTNIHNLEDLLRFLDIPSDVAEKNLLPSPRFPINIPQRIAQKMQPGTIYDPIFRQFVPITQELESMDGFDKEPVQDCSFKKSPRLLQKYESRALIVTTGACAMNCRFCFRQNYPYHESIHNVGDTDVPFSKELEYARKTLNLDEIILSGGDPLSLSNRSLQALFQEIDTIPHIQRIRIHTRFPIGIPERIDDDLCDIFSSSRCQVVFVLHINHIRELDSDIIYHLKKIQRLGIPILSQTVLLQGVNDSVESLVLLMKGLGNIGVIPYYLHQLDKVQGAHHFEVPIEDGKTLIEEMRKVLSGYLVPLYVQEIPGMPGKTALI